MQVSSILDDCFHFFECLLLMKKVKRKICVRFSFLEMNLHIKSKFYLVHLNYFHEQIVCCWDEWMTDIVGLCVRNSSWFLRY